jgi:hypothetical protein
VIDAATNVIGLGVVLGFRYLGRWNFLGESLIAVFAFSVSINFFIEHLPVWLDQYPLTDLHGVASDYTFEVQSSVRTVTVINNRPMTVSKVLIEGLHPGVSKGQITGMYTDQSHSMLICKVYRPQSQPPTSSRSRSRSERLRRHWHRSPAWSSTFTPLNKN